MGENAAWALVKTKPIWRGEGVPPLRLAGILPARNPSGNKAKMASPRNASSCHHGQRLPCKTKPIGKRQAAASRHQAAGGQIVRNKADLRAYAGERRWCCGGEEVLKKPCSILLHGLQSGG